MKITILLSVCVILIAGIVFALTIDKNRPTAYEDEILPSSILVHFNENGVSATGIARFGGDCGSDYFPTQAGGVSCSLEATTKKSIGPEYEISGITFQSFTAKRTISLPLQSRSAGRNPIYIPPGTSVSLLVSIQQDGTVTMRLLKNGELIDLPRESGLFLP